MSKTTKILLTILLITLVALVVVYLKSGYKFQDFELLSQKSQPEIATTPSPSPKAILQGTETYSVSQPANHLGPNITKVVVDPHDPKLNQEQTLTVFASDPNQVLGVNIEVIADNTSYNLPLKLISGSPQEGIWSAKYIVKDTVLYRYLLKLSSHSASGNNQFTITIR